MKKIFNIYKVLLIIALILAVSCNDKKDSDKTKIVKLSLDELMKKYGPENMSETEIQKIIDSIKWTTNDNTSILGSPDAKKGGEIVGGSAYYPATLRTVGENAGDFFVSTIESFIYESLLGLDPITLEYIPALADKWSLSDDKSIYYFHINDIAAWSDGMPVTSFDVVASWDLFVSDGIRSPFMKEYYSRFERPLALTDKVIMVKPKTLEWYHFMSFSGMSIMPEHIIGRITPEDYMKNYNEKMMPGSGPYMFDKAERNQYIVLKKNENWWAMDFKENKGLFNFEKIRFIFYTEESIIDEKFKKGEIDILGVRMARKWVQDFVPEKIKIIKNNHVIKQRVYTQFSSGIQGYWMNLREEPFNDIRVRKAVAMLYNREKMMDNLFFNEYQYQDSFFPNSPYENKNNPKIRYNVDEAIRLLEEAGWLQENINDDGYLEKDGKVFEIDVTDYSGDNRIYTVFQEDLALVGIKLNIKQVTWAEHIKEANERNFKIFHAAYTGSNFPRPEGSFHSKYADKKNTQNYSGIKIDRVDEIIEEYNFEYNLEKRIKLLQELDNILAKQHIMVFDWYLNNIRMLYWNKFDMPEFVFSRFDRAGTSSIITYWWHDEKKAKMLNKVKGKNKPLEGKPEDVNYWQNYERNY